MAGIPAEQKITAVRAVISKKLAANPKYNLLFWSMKFFEKKIV